MKDELAGVGDMVPKIDLVSLALLGLHKSWDNFQDAVRGREKLPESSLGAGVGLLCLGGDLEVCHIWSSCQA